MDQTINLNAAYCIQKATNFGATIFTNICSGKITSVPWGTADWAAAVALGLFVGLIAAVFLSLMALMVKTVWDL